ncbi:RHS repeat domain-containing protein, partial [Flavobacterium restrictum]
MEWAQNAILRYPYKGLFCITERSGLFCITERSGYTQTDSNFDFAGKPQYTETKHKRTNADPELLVKEEYTYSNQGRLLTHSHQINGGSKELLTQNKYDDLGQLQTKKVGGTTGLQKVDYSYNIRGWLKEINKYDNLSIDPVLPDLFGFKINYNDNATTASLGETVVNQLYNGNISETYWKVLGASSAQKYGYEYDNLNRLSNAKYQDPGNAVVTNAYNENLTYDKNGNIQTLVRNDALLAPYYNTVIDNLIYTYKNNNPNQLLKVTDNSLISKGFLDVSGDDYTYDANGNMTTDNNKGINTPIQYNHLNLPTKIDFGTKGNITYIYNALGQKVSKTVAETAKPAETTDYLSGFQYKNNTLQYFPTAEGYANNTAGVYNYVYNYTDHLGNVRVSYTQQSGSLKILEENNYYPFGLKHQISGPISAQPEYKYKYNGKELQDELGLNMYDYGARNYDPALGRWMNIDPLAEIYRRWSPY